MTQKDMMNKLYKDYNLVSEDVFSHKHYKIITRSGIEKIQARSGIVITYTVEPIISAVNNVVMRAYASKADTDTIVTTFASAHEGNCNSNYYAEMAEKRAMSRAVLKMEGLYEYGFFGEDEADDFKKSNASFKSAKIIN